MENKKHKYEWYLSSEDEYIYDDEVIKFITPKLEDAKLALENVKCILEDLKLNGNIIHDYLEIGEALSTIEMFTEDYK